ncbi:tyrosine-type recombinase/integrase [Novosphingobium sp.]|uniref:tyrosine-type recombinase/integrase n=1 Tax=Novosphingobium sp. TaxID=1874826 RepID=UPI0035B322C6
MSKRMLNKLSATFAAKTKEPGRHSDGGGLYLFIDAQGRRRWIFMYARDGKRVELGLGSGRDLPLADARAQAAALRTVLEKGGDPRAELRKDKAGKTFREVAEAFIDRKESGWRNEKHRQQWRNTLEAYAYPSIGALPVREITTEHVLKVLEPIWQKVPETASRLRGRIENILSAAKVQGLRSGENPALWRGHLDHLLSKPGKLHRGHHPSLPYVELPDFMAALRDREAVAARALEFLILTGARAGEVTGATWAEVDLKAGLWTVPAERMKAQREHIVPLTPRAVAILDGVLPLRTEESPTAPIFPANGGGQLSGMAMPMLLRRMHKGRKTNDDAGWIDPKAGGRMITVHGFRSTFRDWAGEQSSFPREVIEHALAHGLADKTEAAYQRGSLLAKRRKLMDAWASYCEVRSGEKVVKLRRKSAVPR